MCRVASPLFCFNDTPRTLIYTLSLHDALPISRVVRLGVEVASRGPRSNVRTRKASQHLEAGNQGRAAQPPFDRGETPSDRKSTRLNSSHSQISYAVFCLKKKNISLKTIIEAI